jgi:DUF971 family protein
MPVDNHLGTVIKVTDIRLPGAYGVQFVPSGRHCHGIFLWVLLRDLLERKSAVSAEVPHLRLVPEVHPAGESAERMPPRKSL